MTILIRICMVMAAIFGIGWVLIEWERTAVHFRYRLTVELEAHGKALTASSVFACDYWLNRLPTTMKLSPGQGGPSRCQGVSPMFDLGPDRTLFAAFDCQIDAFTPGLVGRAVITSLPMLAYKMDVHDIWRATKNPPVTLPPNIYPAFIWKPRSENWRDAKQLHYSEIASAVGSYIKVINVILAPDPSAKFDTKIEPAPAWLIALRDYEAIHRGSGPVRPGVFSMSSGYIESFNPLTNQ